MIRHQEQPGDGAPEVQLTIGQEVQAKPDLGEVANPQLSLQPVEADPPPGRQLLLHLTAVLQIPEKTLVQRFSLSHGPFRDGLLVCTI